MTFEAHYEREGTTGWLVKSWDDANTLLGYQKAEGPSYTVFSLKNGSYIQCAGGKKSLVVEARIFNESGSFKHYRFGNTEKSGAHAIIECNCGPITVDKSQVLTMRDARLIIKQFVESNGMALGEYHASDITSMFQ
ncbi:hypothetical protein [Ectopseudomonas mendocina]|uniref:Uncharacterized protein n=1 Tax=Ectopseudomonas mendocina S5.2 TaxID=1225174 RepID=A0ABM5VUU7_ECTME|nr:hypothetical protein [Pseudomonas mendocina]ALN18604.1 hypothetical protein DW68_008165 [Pseudomonas mendocina S5.2]KES00545.1 hypothetical protein HN51_12050 [Pseudomonas mendocina]